MPQYNFQELDPTITKKFHDFYAAHSLDSSPFTFVTAQPKDWKSNRFYAYCWHDLKVILLSPLFLENIRDFLDNEQDFTQLPVREKRALLHEMGHDYYKHGSRYDTITDYGATVIASILALCCIVPLLYVSMPISIKIVLAALCALIITLFLQKVFIQIIDKKKEFDADSFAFKHMKLGELLLFGDLSLFFCPQETTPFITRIKRTHATLYYAGKRALQTAQKRIKNGETITLHEYKKLHEIPLFEYSCRMFFQSLNFQRTAHGKKELSTNDYLDIIKKYQITLTGKIL